MLEPDLRREALLHPQWAPSRLQSYERLEFLGDAVLELIVTEYLFEKYPDSNEGDLTAYRASLVNAITLSEVAQKINVNDFLLLSKGEARDTGKARQYILANTMEAILGAIYAVAVEYGCRAWERRSLSSRRGRRSLPTTLVQDDS